MRQARFLFLLAFAFLLACGDDGGCSGAGILFKVVPDFGNCSPGGSTFTIVSIVDAQADDELYVSADGLPGGVTAAWQPNMQVRSEGTMTFTCSDTAVPGATDVRLAPYVVSMEGKTFADLIYRLTVQ